ncbi:hypothetical protein DRH14_05665 [Candidatus Shapirobacteria bacterium]|nr:MAG: hypothetical protein DRH14_05665 [Candidatus Shapirobacteria bacterium]
MRLKEFLQKYSDILPFVNREGELDFSDYWDDGTYEKRIHQLEQADCHEVVEFMEWLGTAEVEAKAHVEGSFLKYPSNSIVRWEDCGPCCNIYVGVRNIEVPENIIQKVNFFIKNKKEV